MGLSPADLPPLAVSAEHDVLRAGAAPGRPRVRRREHQGSLRGRGPGRAGRGMNADAASPGAESGAESAAEPAPLASLRQEDLHASLSDPVLDTMNFLNEVTFRYPAAISFAPGRPYDGFFDTEQIFTHIRRYLDHLVEHGTSPEQVRAAMFQYGPTAGQIREMIAESLRE